MAEEIKTKKEEEKVEDKKLPEKGEGKKADENPEERRSWFMEHIENTASRAQEILGSDGGSPEGQEQKKEASGALLGCKLGLLGLGGIIALALGGTIIGLQKLATADKWFMKGFNTAFSGGMKGGGGKKEKA